MLIATFKAKRVSAEAVDNRIGACQCTDPLDCIMAFLGVGAPPDHAVVVGERLAVPSHVLLQDQIVVNAVAFRK